MGEEQGQQTGTAAAASTVAPPVSGQWGDPISEERQHELEAVLQEWEQLSTAERRVRNGPLTGGRWPLKGADVFYLAVRALAGPAGDRATAEAQLRAAQDYPDLQRELDLSALHLERAVLYQAHLEGAVLNGAHLEGGNLIDSHLEGATLRAAHLERALLRDVHLERAALNAAHLEGATLERAHLESAILARAHLEGAVLERVHLEGTFLNDAHLEGAALNAAHLEGAIMDRADLEGVRRWAPGFPAQLAPADLRGAFLDDATRLTEAILGTSAHGFVTCADARWRGVNLAVVALPPADQLGDERVARLAQDAEGKGKDRDTRLGEFQAAVRANRQLAVALQGQGLSEEGGRFAYRAQLLQQQVLWRQRKLGGYLFARFLDGLAGYGYKPLRGVLAYVLVIAGFAALYALATHGQLTFGLPPSQLQPLTWYEALVLSISSFHGRGFFQPVQSLGDPVAILAAGEAIIGLLIEISFIATFTQRFFGAK